MRLPLAIAAAFAAAPALACPVCASGDAPDLLPLVAGMIAAPYVVAALVVRAIRAAGGDR
jgi:hypothetical protein